MQLPMEHPISGTILRQETAVDTEPDALMQDLHPLRRVSDNCPISRVRIASDYPPTSPKIHELRERNAERSAAGWNATPFPPK